MINSTEKRYATVPYGSQLRNIWREGDAFIIQLAEEIETLGVVYSALFDKVIDIPKDYDLEDCKVYATRFKGEGESKSKLEISFKRK